MQLLDRDSNIKLLKAVGKRLAKKNLVSGQVEQVLGARVPIIKFIHKASNIDVDICVASIGTFFKDQVIQALSAVDKRFAKLFR